LAEIFHSELTAADTNKPLHWKVYACSRCACPTLACAASLGGDVLLVVPQPKEINTAIPDRARKFLIQAVESVHAPSGAVMLAASSVDAMLKAKGYKKGRLYDRIEEAATNHLITAEMAEWAHEVRLDANDERHADEAAPFPKKEDAQRCIAFAKALAEFMFVLPARVARGRSSESSDGFDGDDLTQSIFAGM
jgi:hypothetical protein